MRWCGFLSLMLTGISGSAQVNYVGPTTYLNDSRAVVTHTFDDTVTTVINALDALDKYGVKATAFVSTERKGIEKLWPRLNQAIANGHEVGSHSRRHQCKWPDTQDVCKQFYDDYEVKGSRDDILKNTTQPYVWSWCYPCGNCADYDFAWAKIKEHGYLAARNYPGEQEDRHNLPNLQAWADNFFNAAYTQVVQKKGGIAKSGRTNVAELNAKFDEVYGGAGIYHFLSHPAWLEFGEDAFYEQHLKYIGKRSDVWYVPFGPLYAYKTLKDSIATEVVGRNRFKVSTPLSAKIYDGSVTLEFRAPGKKVMKVYAGGRQLRPVDTGFIADRWNDEYVRQDGFRVLVTVKPRTELLFR